jgi:hypothetical protein
MVKYQQHWIRQGCRIICYEVQQLIYSIWNKDELLEVRKESIIVPIYKKPDKRDCSNYRGISLLSAAYKILSCQG